jgi:pSer/pThr/pTyr-binding forkhead associated (FHA) protein
MARITIQILEGFERGRTFSELPVPVTIGREEDNTIQLNDERVSRFHVKIQEDETGQVILTDLDSTNGTRINGHPVQMRVLQFGDQMSIGRSLLVYGSPKEIEDALKTHGPRGGSPDPASRTASGKRTVSAFPGLMARPDESSAAPDDEPQELFPAGPPDLPGQLLFGQKAQLSDLLAWLHEQIAQVVIQAHEERKGTTPQATVDWETWQRLLAVEMTLARYLRQIASPE